MLVALQVLIQIAIAGALLRPVYRGRVAVGTALLAVVAAVSALVVAGDQPRTLEVTHKFSAYVGNELGNKDFPIETTEAPAAAWLLLVAGFLALWTVVLWLLRPRPGREPGTMHPFWVPMVLAWTSSALVLGLEKTAAPSELVRFFAFDRGLFFTTVAAAVLLAERCRSVFLTLSWMSLFVTLTRLPLALFGTFATRHEWGTSLDVHSIEHFANPLVQRTVSVEPASTEQLAWLIWAPHLLVLPALYMMSTSGFALGRLLFLKGAEVGD
ncbi:MAG: hypothetical protein KDB80_04800 [Planctomycetes bacterium]|nr:hypothetical protein [Planctomycetota bacterium]